MVMYLICQWIQVQVFMLQKKNERYIFGFEAHEQIHMGILDVLFHSLNVEATNLSQTAS